MSSGSGSVGDVRYDRNDDLSGAEFDGTNLSGALLRDVDLSDARVVGANLTNLRMSGLIRGMTVNDVEIGPLIDAELNRLHPERTKLRPTDAAGVREAFAVIEALWIGDRSRAAELDEDLLRRSVDGEWSWLETMRHLVFVTDVWIGGFVLGRTGHHHPLGLPPSFVDGVALYGFDPDVEAGFDDVVAAREDRLDVLREVVAGLDDAALERDCGEGRTVQRCLHVTFDEEWAHHRFANRDLDALTSTP